MNSDRSYWCQPLSKDIKAYILLVESTVEKHSHSHRISSNVSVVRDRSLFIIQSLLIKHLLKIFTTNPIIGMECR